MHVWFIAISCPQINLSVMKKHIFKLSLEKLYDDCVQRKSSLITMLLSKTMTFAAMYNGFMVRNGGETKEKEKGILSSTGK